MRRAAWRRFWAALGLVAALLADAAALGAAPRPWPHDRSPLDPDPEVVWGTLENGFRYALLPRDRWPGQVSMRLMVEAGSLDESEDERGYAHFVEHMALAGTRRFPPGELISFFQRLGMDFGSHVNAFTYHDRTVYHLELPRSDRELLVQSLSLYRDYLDGALFEPRMIEREREVILREKGARELPSALIQQAAFRVSLAGTRLEERNPIGTDAAVLSASRGDLVAFYRKWYRPDLTTLVAAGDFEAAVMEAEIEAAFGSLALPEAPPPERRIGEPERLREPAFSFLQIEGAGRYTVQASRAWKKQRRNDRMKWRRRDFLRSFAAQLLDERMRRETGGTVGNFVSYDRIFGLSRASAIASSGGMHWIEGALWLDSMLRQAYRHGFAQEEIAALKKRWRAANASSVDAYESARPSMLVDGLAESIASGLVYRSVDDQRSFFGKMLEKANRRSARRAFRDMWRLDELRYFVAGELGGEEDARGARELLRLSRKSKLPPYAAGSAGESLELDPLGAPGEVVETWAIEGLEGARAYRFANEARLVALPTDHERGSVHAMVRVGGGLLEFRDANPATHALALDALFRGGVENHGMEAVYAAVTSKLRAFYYTAEPGDAFVFQSVSDPEGVEFFFRLVAGYLSDPGIEDEAAAQAMRKLRQDLELQTDGLADGYRTFERRLFRGEPVFLGPAVGDVDAASVEAMRAWITEAFYGGYLEATVVGDIDLEGTVAQAARTIGALPPRRAFKRDFAEARALRIAPRKGRELIEYDADKGEGAVAMAAWTVQDPELTGREGAAFYLLAKLFENRLRKSIREGMGKSYAPLARWINYPAFDALRILRAEVDCLKEDALAIREAILEVAASLARKPPDENELAAAARPLAETVKQGWESNHYLLNSVLYGALEYPHAVENALQYRNGLLNTIGPEEIGDLARRHLAPEDAYAAAIAPEAKEPAPAGAAASGPVPSVGPPAASAARP